MVVLKPCVGLGLDIFLPHLLFDVEPVIRALRLLDIQVFDLPLELLDLVSEEERKVAVSLLVGSHEVEFEVLPDTQLVLEDENDYWFVVLTNGEF